MRSSNCADVSLIMMTINNDDDADDKHAKRRPVNKHLASTSPTAQLCRQAAKDEASGRVRAAWHISAELIIFQIFLGIQVENKSVEGSR